MAANFVSNSDPILWKDNDGVVRSTDTRWCKKKWRFNHINKVVTNIYKDVDIEDTDNW